MSLSLALGNAISGLRLNQQSLAVLSQNIANVNTEGYSRKIINQDAIYIEGVGSGVRITDIVRKVDNYLSRSVQSQGSQTGRLSMVDDYYQRMQVLLGEPGSTNSIDEYLTTFFSTFQQMADAPEHASYRSNMLNAANILAQGVSSLAYDIHDLRYQADRDISEGVQTVNSALKKLYTLNTAIASASGGGQSTAGLLDERDKALQIVSSYLNVDITYQSNGTVNVTTGNGIALVDGQLHELRYSGAPSVDSFINNDRLNPLTVVTLDDDGNQSGQANILVTGGSEGQIISSFTSGKLQGLIEVRDDLMVDTLHQLDMLASRLRDEVNTIHNDGSGYPPAASLTGTRAVHGTDAYDWSGSIRVAVLDAEGGPVNAGYADELYTGWRPLTLDFATLNSGDEDGRPTIQSIIDEINWHFSAPPVKTKLGNLNNIELVSDVDVMPPTSGLFNFDFELDNISADDARFFVSGVTVLDDTGSPVTSAASVPAPSIALNPSNTYETTNGSGNVFVNLLNADSLKAGDVVYLEGPSAAAATAMGISASNLTGYFTIVTKAGNKIEIVAAGADTATVTGSTTDATGVKLFPPYETVTAGEKIRTHGAGNMQVNLSSNLTSSYYDMQVTMTVMDEDGIQSTATVTYRVNNVDTNLRNDRYYSRSVTGAATQETPTTPQHALRAMLVDAEGRELYSVNGEYTDAAGYLRIVGNDGLDYRVAIDELDSSQNGDTSTSPITPGTGWGFGHFFGLNNFFTNNEPTSTGDTLRNSALNLAVEQELLDNPSLVSTGQLGLSNQPAGVHATPVYTYERFSGDNSVAQRIAALTASAVSFDTAGSLPATRISLQGYTGQLLGLAASKAAGSQVAFDNAQTLYDGLKSRLESSSGVNLDEELANTVVFQNSYAATARIVNVVDKMFESLIGMLG